MGINPSKGKAPFFLPFLCPYEFTQPIIHYPNHKALTSKLALLKNKYDGQFKIVFDALRELMKSPLKPRRKIGFEGKT